MKINVTIYAVRFTILLAVGCFTAVSSSAQQPSQADLYRRAAAAYREAAAKCPARKACYLANAQHQECLARSMASGSNASCSEPTCDMTKPACEGGADGGNSSNNNTMPNNQPLGTSVSEAQGAMDNLIRYYENKSAEIDARRRARQQKQRNDADSLLDEINSETRDPDAERGREQEIDERALARKRAYEAQKKAAAATASNNSQIVPPIISLLEMFKWANTPAESCRIPENYVAPIEWNSGNLLTTKPAYPDLNVGSACRDWSPWYMLKSSDNLTNIDGLDVALYEYCSTGGSNDRPLQVEFRNRTTQPVTITYDLFLLFRSIRANDKPEWNTGYKITVPACGAARGPNSLVNASSIQQLRATSITNAAKDK